MKNNRGSSMIEVLISLGLVSFVIVAILTGFTQQQVSTSKNYSKNLAVALAESSLEEQCKFPASQLITGTTVDYIVPGEGSYTVHDSDPKHPDKMRRTLVITQVGTMADIDVTVEYGFTRGQYPFSVNLHTRRAN